MDAGGKYKHPSKKRSVKKYSKAKPGKRQARTWKRALETSNICTLSRNPKQPFPSRLRTVLQIANQGMFASGAGSTTGTFLVHANDCTAPFNTGTALPNPVANIATLYPNCFAQLTSAANGPYIRWKVYATKADVTIAPTNSSDSVNCALGCPLNSDDAAFSTVITASQSRNSESGVATQMNPLVFSKYLSTADVYGLTRKKVDDDPAYAGSYHGTAPALIWNWQVIYETCDQAVLTGPLAVTFHLTMWVEFYEFAGAGSVDN
jgi:hypothetical protein